MENKERVESGTSLCWSNSGNVSKSLCGEWVVLVENMGCENVK